MEEQNDLLVHNSIPRYHLLCIRLKIFVFKYWPSKDGWVLVKHPMMSKGNEIYIDFLQSMSRFGIMEIFHKDPGSKWILRLV